MNGLKFEWDKFKARLNLNKHGVSFSEAESVFWDDFARLIPDPDSSIGEERFVLIGRSRKENILVVCHCYRRYEQCIRIISARKASRKEIKQYEGFINAK